MEWEYVMIAESLNKEFDRFKLKKEDIPDQILFQAADRRNLNPRELPDLTEIAWNEIESALESIDDRKDHRRVTDAILDKAIDLYDNRSYDLVLSNISYNLKGYSDGEEFSRASRPERFYFGEFDVLLVDIDNRELREIEAKPHRGLPRDESGELVWSAPSHEQKARDQLERHKYAIDLLNERVDGFEWGYVGGEVVYESELHFEHEIPDHYEGKHYWTDESREKAIESEDFRLLRENLVTGDAATLAYEDSLTVVEKGEELEFLD